ncbi:chemotaxis-specific protein-glutamate methyltransferase CheB [Legionella lytica]|uniref:Protein-glutamate methylesterase/protein-glutamine glutaminase n=1 Tax=Legionella lytica TaxID=96232 RepID=A0ABW8D6I6_9GAMM
MIRVLIVDDSPTEVALIQHIIESTHDMIVVGVAKNGKEAIELTTKLKPDLITMDIQMPVLDGLEATRIIMAHHPTPIVVISSTVSDESLNATFHILEAGALTALTKPINIFSPSFKERSAYIIDTLRSLSDIRVTKKPLKMPHEDVRKITKHKHKVNVGHYELIAMGASVGGPMALKTILSHLPPDFSLPIVVVQHMSNGFIRGFVQWLEQNVSLKVKVPTNGELLEKGTVYIAPDKKHLQIRREHDRLVSKLIDGDSNEGFCPSITELLQSVAKVSGKKAIGVLLTGMSDDGAEGLLALKQAHGHTLIQGPGSAVVFGMGAVAQSIDAVDQVIELDSIASYLTTICI